MPDRKSSPMKMEARNACSCGGTQDDVELRGGKSAATLFWQVRCTRCGRETAKHRTPEAAVHEWNHPQETEEQA